MVMVIGVGVCWLTLLMRVTLTCRDVYNPSSQTPNASIYLHTPVDNGVVYFRWDCYPRASLLRYELVIELLRNIDLVVENDDGHGHSRATLPRGAPPRRAGERSVIVQRTRYITVKSIAPSTCEYRTDELETNCEYAAFVAAFSNHEQLLACSNNQTFHTSARVIQHMVITTEILLSIGLVFLLWLCAVGAFLRQWKFVQLSTPYEATRLYKPQNVDQIRIINREEDGIIYRHSVANTARRMTSPGCSASCEQLTVRVVDEPCKASDSCLSSEDELEQVQTSRKKSPETESSGCGPILKKKRSMPSVNEMAQLDPLLDVMQPSNTVKIGGRYNLVVPNEPQQPQQLTVAIPADVLSKAESAPNIFVTDLCTD